MIQFPLRTERLAIRPVTAQDLPALFAILADADVMKLALYGRPLTVNEALQFIRDDFAKNERDVTHLGVVCRNDDDAVIGFAGLLPCEYYPGDLELGFVLAAAEQRKGFATELGRKLIDVALEDLQRKRLLALCEPRNTASRHVLEAKLAMTRIDEIETPNRGRRVVFAKGAGPC